MCDTALQKRKSPDEQNGNSVAEGVYQAAAALTNDN